MARIEHFAVFAPDSPALKDFYVRAMGMTVALESGGDPPGYFLADDHGTALEIIGRPPGESGVNQRGLPRRIPRSATWPRSGRSLRAWDSSSRPRPSWTPRR